MDRICNRAKTKPKLQWTTRQTWRTVQADDNILVKKLDTCKYATNTPEYVQNLWQQDTYSPVIFIQAHAQTGNVLVDCGSSSPKLDGSEESAYTTHVCMQNLISR